MRFDCTFIYKELCYNQIYFILWFPEKEEQSRTGRTPCEGHHLSCWHHWWCHSQQNRWKTTQEGLYIQQLKFIINWLNFKLEINGWLLYFLRRLELNFPLGLIKIYICELITDDEGTCPAPVELWDGEVYREASQHRR